MSDFVLCAEQLERVSGGKAGATSSTPSFRSGCAGLLDEIRHWQREIESSYARPRSPASPA